MYAACPLVFNPLESVPVVHLKWGTLEKTDMLWFCCELGRLAKLKKDCGELWTDEIAMVQHGATFHFAARLESYIRNNAADIEAARLALPLNLRNSSLAAAKSMMVQRQQISMLRIRRFQTDDGEWVEGTGYDQAHATRAMYRWFQTGDGEWVYGTGSDQGYMQWYSSMQKEREWTTKSGEKKSGNGWDQGYDHWFSSMQEWREWTTKSGEKKSGNG